MSTIPNKGTICYTDGTTPVEKLSNEVLFTVVGDKITIIKTQAPEAGLVGSDITYTLTIKNTGTTAQTNVLVRDILDAKLQFINLSIKVDGVDTPGSIVTGITLPTIAAGATKVVTFRARVLSA